MKLKKMLTLGLAGASMLTGGFLLSGCGIKDNTASQPQVEQPVEQPEVEQPVQQEKEVSSVKLVESSIPKYIIRNKFYRTNIKAIVTYIDETTKEIDVTEYMIEERDRENLGCLGQYNIKINYGGKSTTMYTKVVDERYLLNEVIEANIGRDVTKTTFVNSVKSDEIKLDIDNNIMYFVYKLKDETHYGYNWLNNGITYKADEHEGSYDCSRDLDGSLWKDRISKNAIFVDVDEVINENQTKYGKYTITSITQDEDANNYVLDATLTRLEGSGNITYKYVFNDNYLQAIYEDNNLEYKYNYDPVSLTLPKEIKDMEKDAVIDADLCGERIREIFSNTLNRDFIIRETIEEDLDRLVQKRYQFDATNKILIYEVIEYVLGVPSKTLEKEYYWLKENYVYNYILNSSGVIKSRKRLKSTYFTDVILLQIFGHDVYNFNNYEWNKEQTINVKANGRYELKLVRTYDYSGVTATSTHKYAFNAEGLICMNDFYKHFDYSKEVDLKVPDWYAELEESAEEQDYDWWLNNR